MAEDYKPVNDRTINDVNEMNRDAWDSGEFRHENDSSPYSRISRKEDNRKKFSQRSEVGQRQLAAEYIRGHAPGEGRREARRQLVSSNRGRVLRSDSSDAGNDSVAGDFLTHPGGAGSEAPRLHSQREERETGDAVHLPRRASRQWRKRTWE